MRGISVLFVMAALAAGAPAGAADLSATQPAPPKAPVAAQPTPPPAQDDIFTPLMRGTPGGRISGGTRGVRPRSMTPAVEPPSPAPHAASAGAGTPVTGAPEALRAVAK